MDNRFDWIEGVGKTAPARRCWHELVCVDA